MSLDTKLLLDAISELFDKFDARWTMRDAAREAFGRVHVTAQSTVVGADVVADNWGNLFDSGVDSDEQRYEEPINTDNWGGFFGGEDAAANAEFAIDSPDDPKRFILPNAYTDEPSIDLALARTNSGVSDDSVNALVTSTDTDALLDVVPADALASFTRPEEGRAPFFHNEISGDVPALAHLTCFARRDLAALQEFELPPTDDVIRACDINRRRPPREGATPPALPRQPTSRLRGRAGCTARALLPRPRRLRDSLRPRQGHVQGLLVPRCRRRIRIYVVVGHCSPTIHEAASKAPALDDWLLKPLAHHRLLGRAYYEEDEVFRTMPTKCSTTVLNYDAYSVPNPATSLTTSAFTRPIFNDYSSVERNSTENGTVLVVQFAGALRGLRATDGEDLLRILHLNPRLRSDWSDRPMLEMNTCFELSKGSISRWFSEPSVPSQMKLWPCKVIPGPGDKPMIVVNFKGEEKQLAAEEISLMVLIKMEDTTNNFARGYYAVGKGIMLVANNFDDGLFYGSNELRSFIILPWDIVDHIQPRFFTASFIDATSVDDAVVWFCSATNATHAVLKVCEEIFALNIVCIKQPWQPLMELECLDLRLVNSVTGSALKIYYTNEVSLLVEELRKLKKNEQCAVCLEPTHMGVTSGCLPEGCVIANLCGCVTLTGCGHMASDINAQVLLIAGELIQGQKQKSHNGCGGNTNVIISIQQDLVQCCVSFPLSNCCFMHWVVCWKPPWPLQPRQDISAELRPIPWPSFGASDEATARQDDTCDPLRVAVKKKRWRQAQALHHRICQF
jgi:hypothetical protein